MPKLSTGLFKQFLIIAIALGLSGCATTREQIEKDVDYAVSNEVPAQPQTWVTPANIGETQIGWIEAFNDQTLTTLVKEAQANNKNLQAIAANVDQAWALTRQAGSALQPQVGLSTGGTRSGVRGGGSSKGEITLGAQVSWEADLWGRIRSGVRAQEASAQAVEADFVYAQHSLAATTAKSYFTAIESNLQANIERETVTILEETRRITQVKFDNGLSTAQDVALSRSDLASARERLTASEGAYRNALRSLELLLGRYPSAEVAVHSSLPGVPPAPPAGLPSELLERRPDIIAADRRVAAAFNRTEEAKAAKLPSLSLTGNLGGASNALSNVLNPGNLAWSVGASLLAPIFDGGQRQAQVEVATAAQEQSLAQYGEAALNAFAEIENNLDNATVIAQREIELTEASNQANEAFRIANLRYNAGESELLDVLSIQQRVVGAQRSLSSIKRLLLEQRINLNLALGGDWKS